MDNVITINNLVKSYGDVLAVDNISFSVKRASLFAFLGINGAGKSTTINILCTLLGKDGGQVIINGHDLDKDKNAIKNDIGIVFQGSVMDGRLTVRDNLTTKASFYGLYGDAWKKRLAELVDMLSLEDILGRPYGKLSGGQRRRVDIARALIHCPKILFLDEPTTGLDPSTRKKIWEIIEELRKTNNTTIFLTTHYMEEADSADDVVIIDKGHIIAHDTPAVLKDKYSGTYVRIYSNVNRELESRLEKTQYIYDSNCYKVAMDSTTDVIDFLDANRDIISDFEVIKGNMDDVFLNATGRSLKEALYEQN